MKTRKQITALETTAAAGHENVTTMPVVSEEYWLPSRRPRRHNPWDTLLHRARPECRVVALPLTRSATVPVAARRQQHNGSK